ncbi:MAG: zinc ribbon-containing protein [Oleiphilaceae bacterium]|nr:zinc ribbon-containing protein [Oleiphilaceae bacterium]
MSEKPKALGPVARKTYDRMLARVEKRLGEAEARTWQRLQEEIDEAVEFEEGVKELTREELHLLAAYLRRDLSHMVRFISETGKGVREWLHQDLEQIEHRVVDLLFSIADRTRLDTLELQQRLDHGPNQYISGELATAGVLRCLDCGERLHLTGTTVLEPCHACESRYFERVTGE